MTSDPAPGVRILVDADACPVKDEIYKVAWRREVPVTLVSNAPFRIPQHPLITRVIVSDGFDAADDWIADHIRRTDICVTNDIPLAGRCLREGAFAVKPNGNIYTDDNIGMALATRKILEGVRETGGITGGPPPFSKADRSKFLNQMEMIVQEAGRL